MLSGVWSNETKTYNANNTADKTSLFTLASLDEWEVRLPVTRVHAAPWRASICRSQLDMWFQLAMFWSTNFCE